MDNTYQTSSLGQTTPPQPSQSFFEKIKAHKTPIILSSIGFVIILGLGLYAFSPARNTLVAPANQENLPIAQPSPSPTPDILSGSPTPSTTPTPNPTQNWKTYTNSTYKYSIKYPPDWTARDLGVLEVKIPSYIAFNVTTASSSARHITISATTRTYQEQLALGASSSAITYAGIQGTKQSFQDSDGNTSTVIVLPRTGNLLVLRAKTAYLATFNLMLTTLKITN